MEINAEIAEAQRQYLEFLDDGEGDKVYHESVRNMIKNEETRLIVNIADIRRHDALRGEQLLNHAFNEIIAFERALREYVLQVIITIKPLFFTPESNYISYSKSLIFV